MRSARWLPSSGSGRVRLRGCGTPRVPTGHLMSVQAVCLGWHWYPYAYSRTADDTDGAPVKPLPASVDALARDAVATAYGVDSAEAQSFTPDAAIVNLYPDGAKLGLHQDGEEPSDAPVVTISLGDTCTFRLAGIDRRVGPFLDLELRSGDLLVFGREQRRVFHGVPKVFPRHRARGARAPRRSAQHHRPRDRVLVGVGRQRGRQPRGDAPASIAGVLSTNRSAQCGQAVAHDAARLGATLPASTARSTFALASRTTASTTCCVGIPASAATAEIVRPSSTARRRSSGAMPIAVAATSSSLRASRCSI